MTGGDGTAASPGQGVAVVVVVGAVVEVVLDVEVVVGAVVVVVRAVVVVVRCSVVVVASVVEVDDVVVVVELLDFLLTSTASSTMITSSRAPMMMTGISQGGRPPLSASIEALVAA